MNWLRNFMTGRYGSDQLGWALLVLYLLLSLLLPGKFLRYFCLIPLFLFWFRFLSRNVLSRAAENRIFLQKAEPVFSFFRKRSAQYRDREHRYYTCPGCRQTLRVPRGRGKITITCPKCGRTITKNT